MNIEEVRDYALSLNEQVTEELFVKSWISWRIAGKWFLLTNLDVPEPHVSVKMQPDLAIDLRDRYEGVGPAIHMNKKNWSELYLNQLDDDFVKEQIKNSYNLVVSKLPKKLGISTIKSYKNKSEFMNEKYLELRNYLLSSTNEERNGKVSEMTEDQINDFYKIYHLTFEELGDKKYREGNYIEASLNYECEVKLIEMVQLFELLHDPYEEIIQSKWEELQDARLKLLLAEYHKAAVNWEKQETPDGFVTDVLKRGFWTCWGNNKDAEVLVTGINPSFDQKFPYEPLPTFAGNHEATEWYHFYPSFSRCRGRHWNPILKNVANQFRINQPHEEKAAYLDLFPLRVDLQTDIDKIPKELRASLLRVTQKEIEYLKPRLIVHLNQGSWFYWGIKREHPWMGYDLEKIENYKGKGELYRLCGMQNTDRKILPLTKTNLEGSLLLLYNSQTPRRRHLPEEERLTEEDIREIFGKYQK